MLDKVYTKPRNVRMRAVAVCIFGTFLWGSAGVHVHMNTAQAQDNDSQRDAERKKAAMSLYRLAAQSFQEKRYKDALDKLLNAQELDPNPVIMYNIGRCYEELGDLATAAGYFQKAVADPGLPKNLRAEVGARLPKVLPALRLREVVGLSTTSVAVALRGADTRAREAWQANIEKSREPIKTEAVWYEDPLFWTGAGMTAVGAGLLSFGGVVDAGLDEPISELRDPRTRLDRARTLTLQDDIESDQNLALGMYVAGGVLLAAGSALTILVLDPFSGETSDVEREGAGETSVETNPPPPEDRPTMRLEVRPMLLPGGGGFGFGGRY